MIPIMVTVMPPFEIFTLFLFVQPVEITFFHSLFAEVLVISAILIPVPVVVIFSGLVVVSPRLLLIVAFTFSVPLLGNCPRRS